MKNVFLFLLSIMLICNACTKDESVFDKDSIASTKMESATGRGADVCGSVSKIKLVTRNEANGTVTVTTEYDVKNCTNIVPVTIYLDVKDKNTNQQVHLFSGIPFSSKIPWSGLVSGDYYQFTVFVLRNDTQEVIDAKELSISIP